MLSWHMHEEAFLCPQKEGCMVINEQKHSELVRDRSRGLLEQYKNRLLVLRGVFSLAATSKGPSVESVSVLEWKRRCTE